MKIPESLYNRLKELASKAGKRPEALAIELLREKISEYEGLKSDDISENEIKMIKEKLKKLGYL